jgi:hypothetical protein
VDRKVERAAIFLDGKGLDDFIRLQSPEAVKVIVLGIKLYYTPLGILNGRGTNAKGILASPLLMDI